MKKLNVSRKTLTSFVPLKPENALSEGQQNRRNECELLLGPVFGLLHVLIRDECNSKEQGAEGSSDRYKQHKRTRAPSQVMKLRLAAVCWSCCPL